MVTSNDVPKILDLIAFLAHDHVFSCFLIFLFPPSPFEHNIHPKDAPIVIPPSESYN